MDARGINEKLLTEGAHHSTLAELAEQALGSDRAITF
jgi:sulfur relay (sulfurtransferase) complex TusBCD TusD component (DsrE family)